jgi:hypothetical protein
MLILKVEEVLNTAKIPVDVDTLYELPEEELLGLIETWDLENQKEMRKKYFKVKLKGPKSV